MREWKGTERRKRNRERNREKGNREKKGIERKEKGNGSIPRNQPKKPKTAYFLGNFNNSDCRNGVERQEKRPWSVEIWLGSGLELVKPYPALIKYEAAKQ